MDGDKGKEEALKPLEGTNVFRIKRKKMENTSGQDAAGKKETEAEEDTDEFQEILLEGTDTEYSTEETVLSTSEELEIICNNDVLLSPKESSTNKPKGMKMKRVREEEVEEEEEDKEKKLKADSLSDTGTSKFPTSPIDKFMDSDDKDDQSMRSPPGDQGSSHRKNL